jgi:hypothetical protein
VTAPEWDELPAELREQVDELIIDGDRWLRACKALRDGGPWRLPDVMDVVHRRRAEIADRIQLRPEEPRDPDTLIARVAALPTPPDAIEALWDGDSVGWMVRVYAVTRDPRSETPLAGIRRGSDLRLFNGTVPPWPEAQEAMETGGIVARHFGVPFFFASPETPDIPDVRWWDTV